MKHALSQFPEPLEYMSVLKNYKFTYHTRLVPWDRGDLGLHRGKGDPPCSLHNLYFPVPCGFSKGLSPNKGRGMKFHSISLNRKPGSPHEPINDPESSRVLEIDWRD
jgi:hypothetical protein